MPPFLATAFATESVTLNNTSSWSGSVLWHDGVKLKRHSFFPDKQKTLTVFSAPAITQKQKDLLNQKTDNRFNNVTDFLGLDKGFANNFSNQSAIASYKMWQLVFPSAPKLLYLPLETIILKYLLKVFGNEQHVFSKLILTPGGQELWKKYFSNEHTFMFWGIDGKGRRKALTKIPEKNELINLMQNRKVYPSSPLCFAVLLYSGLACAGGFNQTTWLTQTKEKFLQLLGEMGELSGVKQVAGVPTKNFAESSLAWLNIDSKYVAPTSLDLYLRGED